jgi:ribulose-phosphate 3-epimerase
LNTDFTRLGEAIASIESADAVHIDVMDNHFVPNLTIGLPVVSSIRAATTHMLDIHLMIEDPDQWAPGYAEAGAESVTFHVEAAKAPVRLARELRRLGARVGIGLNPATPVEAVAQILPEVDSVLVMSVEPGFGGQGFLDLVLPKVTQLRRLISQSGLSIWLQMDGGVSMETIERCVQAGADTFVAGSAVFRSDDPDRMVQSLRRAAESTAASRDQVFATTDSNGDGGDPPR